MIDTIYRLLDGGISLLFDHQTLRRAVMVCGLLTPLLLLLWQPPWFLQAYLCFGIPLGFFGFALVLLDLHLWEVRRDRNTK